MRSEKLRVASGVSQLDNLLGGLHIGDNVIWYDNSGSLASVYCLNFIQASQAQNRPLIYVSFDRSPKNLLEKLGVLAQNNQLIILDCFTYGKGSGSKVFLNFYKNKNSKWPCQIIRIDEPRQTDKVMDALYGIHGTLAGEVRFVFESLTGMQELWGGRAASYQFLFSLLPPPLRIKHRCVLDYRKAGSLRQTQGPDQSNRPGCY